MDPGILVPPNGYGGHERLVYLFAKEYQRLGHEIHLLVTEGSKIPGCIIHSIGKEGFPPGNFRMRKAMISAWLFLNKHGSEFDIIHNFGRLAYLIPVLHMPVKKIMTYGREISSRNIHMIKKLGSKSLVFTACSENLLSRVTAEGEWKVIYNAIDFTNYTIKAFVNNDAPLIFLGRIETIKGCHIAIDIAKLTGNKLIIAGNISPLKDEQAYFEKHIRPHIDGINIIHLGAVNDQQKNEWLGKAKALLFPIEWNEPFGIVMIEAMACGTPVIAFEHGSVKEVIDEGITGFKVHSREEMIHAVNKIEQINREGCRQQAEERFDARGIADQYLNVFNNQKRKIVIITTGQPAANPRVMKEYEALKEKKYEVKVLYTYSADWAYQMDEGKFRTGELNKKDFILIGGNPYQGKVAYFFSRLIFKISSTLSRRISSFNFKKLSLVRSSFYLWRFAKKYKADLYIAHYLGALPAAIKASKKNNAAIIFDAEDFHRGEESYYPGQIKDVIELEDKLLPMVNVITGASPRISKFYKALYPQKKIITVNNVFSTRYMQPKKEMEEHALKLFWFSQNIGPNRGLETIVDALNQVDENISLTILGNIRYRDFVENLKTRAKRPERITFREPMAPEEIFALSATFDIGLAAEVPHCLNRDLCLTNKIFTYLLAGNCILASDTAGQSEFMNSNPGIGYIYKNDDPIVLANLIKLLFNDRQLLNICKNNALNLAKTKYNWERESQYFLAEVESVLEHG